MSMAMIDINETAHKLLRELADKTGLSMADVLDRALAAYEREVFFGSLNAGYAQLRADPTAWIEHEADRKQWDATSMDGLDVTESWSDDGRCMPADPMEDGQ